MQPAAGAKKHSTAIAPGMSEKRDYFSGMISRKNIRKSEQTLCSINQLNDIMVGIITFLKGLCSHDVKSKTGLPDAVTV